MQYSESELNEKEELSEDFADNTESLVEKSSTGQVQPAPNLSQQQQSVYKESMTKAPVSLKASCNNKMSEDKKKYVLEMRKELCGDTHITKKDGHLNLKYFNVKKGQYWSRDEQEELIIGVIKFGATKFNAIKKGSDRFTDGNWTETEIRLRTCKLLKIYDLSEYEETKFIDQKQIADEAASNVLKAKKLVEKGEPGANGEKNFQWLVGGILYNPPKRDMEQQAFANTFFSVKNQ